MFTKINSSFNYVYLVNEDLIQTNTDLDQDAEAFPIDLDNDILLWNYLHLADILGELVSQLSILCYIIMNWRIQHYNNIKIIPNNITS